MDRELIKEIIKEYENSSEVGSIKENLLKVNTILLGNEEKKSIGLCEQVRSIKKTIVPLWTLISLIGGTLLLQLAKQLFGS
jgi:hypothetical protein